ncbi:hypothetical protein FA95DRAFT_1577992 [Auriscalpium vulgare]|uniref:Uncharacterized protein n=1 Tax=Auriscalpium vulgare TaxID=40419 RepID=A0ACB8R432_9AGAM|nr:hypothetical protein FA95DRAFT_1577992 [Auriscalpium vulgare]
MHSSVLLWIRHAPKALFRALLALSAPKSVVQLPPEIHRLPPEIHMKIIDWVNHSTKQNGNRDLSTLRACSLVSRFWTQHSQKLLFSQTCPINARERARLLVSLRTNTQLATYMRQIETSLEGDSDGTDLIELLETCPNITALGLWFGPFGSAPDGLVERLRGLKLRITYLHIRGTRADVTPFIDLWPALHRLDYEGPGTHRNALDHFVAFPTTALRSLKVTIRDETTAWILRDANLSALHELEVLFLGETTKSALPELGDALASITSLRLAVDDMLPTQDVLDRCTRLERLEIVTDPQERLTLPRTLRHVAYHWTMLRQISPQSCLPYPFLAESLRGLPALRLVTASKIAHHLGVVSDLVRVCEEMHVEFAVFDCWAITAEVLVVRDSTPAFTGSDVNILSGLHGC